MNLTWLGNALNGKVARDLPRPEQRRSKRKRTVLRVEPLEERRVFSTTADLAGSSVLAEAAMELVGPAGAVEPAGSPSVVGLTPTPVRTAYGSNEIYFNGVYGNGSGETIAIVDAYDDPSIVNDLHKWDAAFGFDNPPSFTKLDEFGGSHYPAADPTGVWEMEEAADVEWAHAIAPKASLVLIECNSTHLSDLLSGVDTARYLPGVVAVSMSWSAPEFPGETADDSHFTTPAGHEGVTFLGASGDFGAFGHGTQGTYIVNYPAASPNVVAVGGTLLTLNANSSWKSETGWGSGQASWQLGGSGGGISAYESQPAYQTGTVTQSRTQRSVPDVSMDADHGVAIYDSYGDPAGPWYSYIGTSVATPMWAGLIAIADQGRAIHGLGSLDGPSQTLPKLYNMVSDDFHDITTGNNGYAAGTGYDLVTGRGSPKANRLVPDLAGGPIDGPGVYDPRNGDWYLRDEDSAGNPDIPVFSYGGFGQPVAGDWDGNGSTTPGIYNPSDGMWYLSNMNQGNGSPVTFQFGYAGTIAVAGDWTGDGITRAGIYDPRTSTWFLDNNQYAGDPLPTEFQFGFPGSIPVAGNFFGTGKATVGVYYPATGTWFILAPAGNTITFQFGFPGTVPVTGDWSGDGTTEVGIYNPSNGMWYLDQNGLASDGNPAVFQYGFVGGIPLTGSWNYVTAQTPRSNAPLVAGFEAGPSGSGQTAALSFSMAPDGVPEPTGAVPSTTVVRLNGNESAYEPIAAGTSSRVTGAKKLAATSSERSAGLRHVDPLGKEHSSPMNRILALDTLFAGVT